MDTHADYRATIDELRRANTFGSREFFSRFALIATGCAVGWISLGLDVIPYWFVAYYGVVFLEKLLLRRFPTAGSRRFLAAMIAVSALAGAVYAYLPVYLWFQPEPVLEFAALVLLVAGCLNIYQLRSRVWPVALACFVPMGSAFVIMASRYWSPPNGGSEFWTALVVSVLISIYFALALVEAHRANRRMLQTQAHLINAQKIEALGTLAAGISHDFRNLLSIIQGNLELLQNHPRASQRNDCIRDALEAARSGNELCIQLGLYSRRIATTPSMVDPIRVVDEVRSMARHILPSKIRLQTQTPSVMDKLYVDESALHAVLLNLIVHARDTVSGPGTISLETYVTGTAQSDRKPGASRSRIVFEVSNTGAATVSELPSGFDDPDPDPATVNGKYADELALASARGFAEHAGGEFRVEPNTGRGTRVLLQLPA